MKNYRIHLIRTAKTDAHLDKRYIGRGDPPLCPAGRTELEKLLEACLYPRVQAVYTSPLLRCRETAGLLYPEVFTQVLEPLTDLDMGEFEGLTFDELKYSGDFLRWVENSADNPPPGGEGMREFAARACNALDTVFRRMMDESVTDAAVVTHRAVIQILLAAMGMPRKQIHQWAADNCMGYTLLLSAQMWQRDGLFEVQGVVPYVREDRLEEEYWDDLPGDGGENS